MKSWVPTRVILLILCVGLSICYVIPVTGSSEQVIKRIPYSGTVIGQNLTKWGTQVWYHGDVDLIFSRLKDLGVKWARIEYWKGHEDYMDSAIDTCRKYGINPLVLVNYPGETSISAEDYGLEVERIVRKYNLSVVELMNEPLEYGMWSSAEAYVNRIKAG